MAVSASMGGGNVVDESQVKNYHFQCSRIRHKLVFKAWSISGSCICEWQCDHLRGVQPPSSRS